MNLVAHFLSLIHIFLRVSAKIICWPLVPFVYMKFIINFISALHYICLITMKIWHLPQLSFFTVLVVFLISSNSSTVYGHCLGDQKALLLKLKNDLTFDSSMSAKLVRWDQNTDCCQWPGVSCDREGHVLVLELDNETISSGVDSTTSLFDLQYLEKLNLAYNLLDAVQIPTEIYKIKT